MSLSTGTKLGPYEILGRIGAGGMGEVYRARDGRLGREVAVKVLPEHLARDPERLARFDREARLLASLNHPNIAAIYGVEERALVMELVGGPTLAERLAGGPMALEEALPVARQMAEALEYAHERGVIHRDLKPANVKLTAEGQVKVLDFGLAKALEDGPAPASSSESPTLSLAATRAGVILGTAAYMSPEQAKGRPVDRRADIWAFGVVVYEMVTGRRLYEGETAAETLAAVMMKEAGLEGLPAGTPDGLRRLLARCLDRDPKRRLRDIGEARIAIEEVLSGAASGGAPSMGRGPRPVLWMALAGAATLAAATLAFVHFGEPAAPAAPTTRFEVAPPDKATFSAMYTPVISPDGRALAAVVNTSGDQSRIWLRRLNSFEGQYLSGTDRANTIFWSPDSRFLAFIADGKLKKIDVASGAITTLSDAGRGQGGSWSRDGVILFSRGTRDPLFRVPESGGMPRPVTTLDESRGEISHRWPQFLPDGKRFLMMVRSSQPDQSGIYAASLESPEKKLLVNEETSFAYAPSARQPAGHLVVWSQGILLARPFDSDRLVVVDEPFPVAERVEFSPVNSWAAFSISENGTLAYLPATGAADQRQLAWFDRSGKRLSAVGPPGPYSDVRLSPDGRRVAVAGTDKDGRASEDIWLLDLSGGAMPRLTFSPWPDTQPVWSPDGKWIAWLGRQNRVRTVYRRPSSGEGKEEPMVQSSLPTYIWDWSPDGRYLLYSTSEGGPFEDLWGLSATEAKQPVLLVKSDFHKRHGQISPDGSWVAYASQESSYVQVYVQRLAGGSGPATAGGKWQISTDGGFQPRWRRDGGELYFLTAAGKLMAVEVKPGTSFEAGPPRFLFDAPVGPFNQWVYLYDVSADGRRFLLNTLVQGATAPVAVVSNWISEEKQ